MNAMLKFPHLFGGSGRVNKRTFEACQDIV